MADDRRSAIDTTVPHSARVWNYLLGGKDHYPVDRTAGARSRSAVTSTAWNCCLPAW